MKPAVQPVDIEALFKTVVNESPVAFYIVQDGEFCYVTPNIRRFTGYGEDELLGRSPLEFVVPEDRKAVAKNALRMLKGELSSPYQFRAVCKNSSIRWIMEAVTPIRYRGRRATLGNCMDFTERRQAEEALKESEERFRLLADSTPAAVYLCRNDERWTMLYLNDAVESLTGYQRKSFLNDEVSFSDLFVTEDREMVYSAVTEALKQGLPFHMVYRIIRADGTLRWVEEFGNAVRRDGGVRYLVGVILDITERKRAEEELLDTKGRFDQLAEQSRTWVWEVDAEGLYTYVSHVAEQVIGYRPEELVGRMHFYDLHPEEGRDAFKSAAFETMARKEAFVDLVNPIRARNGDVVWMSTNGLPVLNHDGSLLGYRGSDIDITERRRAEEDMKSQTAYFQQLFEGSPDAIAILDTEDQFVRVNRGFEKLFGYAGDEIVGRSINDVVVPEGHEEEACASSRAVLEGGIVRKEGVRKRKDGSLVDVSVTGYPVRIDDELVGIHAIYSDITEQKQAEEALRASEEKYRVLCENASDVIWTTDMDLRFTYTSPSADELHGYTPEEITSLTVDKILTPSSMEAIMRMFQEELAAEEFAPNEPRRTRLTEAEIVRKDGSTVWAEVTMAFLRDETGRPTGILGIARDITERRMMQQQLILADRLASVGQLASGIAHELNNPLTSVIGFSELLLRKGLPEDVTEYLVMINKEATRTAGVVNGLLTFARKEGAEKGTVDVNEIIRGVLQLRSYEQRANNILVDACLASDLPDVIGNGDQLQQVLINIVINAEQAMMEARQGGRLTVATERVGRTVRASIADDGPGISPGIMNRLFTPFLTTKEVGKGTGLGLSICHGIVTEHGGKIYAESELGKGATFIIELPIGEQRREGDTDE